MVTKLDWRRPGGEELCELSGEKHIGEKKMEQSVLGRTAGIVLRKTPNYPETWTKAVTRKNYWIHMQHNWIQKQTKNSSVKYLILHIFSLSQKTMTNLHPLHSRKDTAGIVLKQRLKDVVKAFERGISAFEADCWMRHSSYHLGAQWRKTPREEDKMEPFFEVSKVNLLTKKVLRHLFCMWRKNICCSASKSDMNSTI